MVYDPMGSRNRQAYSTDPFDIELSPRAASYNGGPSSSSALLPAQSAHDPQAMTPVEERQKNIGKFGLGIAAPDPFVAAPYKPPVALGPEQPGIFETFGRGIANLPNTLAPGLISGELNDHLNNLVGLVTSIPDIPLKHIRPLGFLPAGGDVVQAFQAMPDGPEKQQYAKAMFGDPINREKFAAQYLREHEKEWASASGKSRLMSYADLPSETLAEQGWRVVFGALGAGNMNSRRQYVGGPMRDVKGTILDVDPATLPADLRQLRQDYLDKKIDYDDFLDDLAAGRWAWSNDPGVVGGLTSFGADVITDPLTVITFGAGKAAQLAERGALARLAIKAGTLLRDADPAGFAALARPLNFNHTAVLDAMRESHPALVDQAMQTLSRRERAEVTAYPVLRVAETLVNKAQAPFSWLGSDKWAGWAQGRIARDATAGVANALGAQHLSALAKLGGADRVGRALGVYTNFVVDALHQRNLSHDLVSSGSDVPNVDPTDIIAGRKRIRTVASEAEDFSRQVAPDFLPSLNTGDAAVTASRQAARDRAALAVSDLTGIDPSAATTFVSRASTAMLQTIHALNFGRVVDAFVDAKKVIVADARAALAAVPSGADDTAHKGRLEWRNRLTLVGERELTKQRAEALLVEVKGGNIGAARGAIETYDALGANFRGDMDNALLLKNMRITLEDMLETGSERLVVTIDPRAVPEPIRTLMLREQARYGVGAYELGLAPTDVWGLVYDDNGMAISARPWVSLGNDAADSRYIPGRIDRARFGLLSGIRGNRLLLEARRRFVESAVRKGLTRGESEALFTALRDAANEREVGSRGLTPEAIWDIAVNLDVSPSVRQRIGDRGFAELLVRAHEGELATVGWSSKFTGRLKTSMAKRGNMVSRIAEDLYPRMRFFLSPLFAAQELMEGPFFNILRGVKPGLKWTDRDLEMMALLDRVNTHERYTDQFEFLMLAQTHHKAVMREFTGNPKMKRLSERLGGLGGLKSVKTLNYFRQYAYEGARQMRKSWDAISPGVWDEMAFHYGVADPVEVMRRYLIEQGFGRGEDARRASLIMDGTKPPTLGKRQYIALHDVSRQLGYPDIGSMRDDAAKGKLTEANYRKDMTDLGMLPHYVDESWRVVNAPSVQEWRENMTAALVLAGSSRSKAKQAVRDTLAFHRERARFIGLPLEEYIANVYTGAPEYLDHAGHLPRGAYTQHVRQVRTDANLPALEPGDERFVAIQQYVTDYAPERPSARLTDSVARSQARIANPGPNDINLPETHRLGLAQEPIELRSDVHWVPNPTEAPGSALHAMRETLGHDAVNAARDQHAEIVPVMATLVDLLDDSTLYDWQQRLHGSKIAAENPDMPYGEMRDRLVARLVTAWASTQRSADPTMGMDFVMQMLDGITRGMREGWVDDMGKRRYGMGLATRQLERVLKDMDRLDADISGPLGSDLLDSIMGRQRRTLDGVSQPVAIDPAVAHYLGYMDRDFIDSLARQAAREQTTPSLRSSHPTYIEDHLGEYREQVLQRLGMTEEQYGRLLQTNIFDLSQYEQAVQTVNRIAHAASMQTFMGHPEWTAAQIQGVIAAHYERIVGSLSQSPSQVLENMSWNVSTRTAQRKGTLLSDWDGGFYEQMQQDYPAAVRSGVQATDWLKPLKVMGPEHFLVHEEMVRWHKAKVEKDTGVTVLDTFSGTGGNRRSGLMPMTTHLVSGTDAMVEDAMDHMGHTLQQDEVIATSEHFTDVVPDVADHSQGVHWAVDFIIEGMGKADAAQLQRLAAYVSHAMGVNMDTFTLAKDVNGNVVVRALALEGPSGLDMLAAKFEHFMPEATQRALTRGSWAVDSGLAMAGTPESPVSFAYRPVQVKRARNWDPDAAKAADEAMADAGLDINAMESEMAQLLGRLRAFENGERDPAIGVYQTQAKRQIHDTPPGHMRAKGAAEFKYAVESAMFNGGLPKKGEPDTIGIERAYYSDSDPEGTGGVIVLYDRNGDIAAGMVVQFMDEDDDAVREVHYTQSYGRGDGQSAFYDLLADTEPQLHISNAIGSAGNFSGEGGIFAYRWLRHRYDVLAERRKAFNTWSHQRQRAIEAARLTGEEPDFGAYLGAPFLQRLRDRGSNSVAEALEHRYPAEAVAAYDDAIRRHAPLTYAARAGVARSTDRVGPLVPLGDIRPAKRRAVAGQRHDPDVDDAGDFIDYDAIDADWHDTVERDSLGRPLGLTDGTSVRYVDDYAEFDAITTPERGVVTIGPHGHWYDPTGYYHDLSEPIHGLARTDRDLADKPAPTTHWVDDDGDVIEVDAEGRPRYGGDGHTPITYFTGSRGADGGLPGALTRDDLTEGHYYVDGSGAWTVNRGDTWHTEPIPGLHEEQAEGYTSSDGEHFNSQQALDDWESLSAEARQRYLRVDGRTGRATGKFGAARRTERQAAGRDADYVPTTPEGTLSSPGQKALGLEEEQAQPWGQDPGDLADSRMSGLLDFEDSEAEDVWAKMSDPERNAYLVRWGVNDDITMERIEEMPAPEALPLVLNANGRMADAGPINGGDGINPARRRAEVDVQDTGLPNGVERWSASADGTPIYFAREADYEAALLLDEDGYFVSVGFDADRWRGPDGNWHLTSDGFDEATGVARPRSTTMEDLVNKVDESDEKDQDLNDWEPPAAWREKSSDVPPSDWDPGYDDTRFQRGPTGAVRAALSWDGRRNATMHFLNGSDVTSGIHETFHLFAEELDPSAKDAIVREYETATGTTGAVWGRDVEEWVADRFEHWAMGGVAPSAQLSLNFAGMAKYARDVLKITPDDVGDPLRAVFEGMFKRTDAPHALFDVNQQMHWEATRTALLREENQANTTHYYARGRSWLQRSMNHPYFGLYPLSYMWGKVLPEMIRFLVKKPFGLDAPLGGLLLAKNVWQSVQLQVQTDEEFRKWIDEHPQAIRLLQLMVPGTPWESPVNVPVVWRRAMQQDLANREAKAKGEEPAAFDLGSAVDDMVSYAMGLGHFAGQMTDVLNEFGGGGKDKAPKQVAPLTAPVSPWAQQ